MTAMPALLRRLLTACLVLPLLVSVSAGTGFFASPALADDAGGNDGDDGDDGGGGHDDLGDGGRGHDDGDDDDDDDDDDDHEEAYERHSRGEIAALSGVIHNLRRRYGGRILDVKLRTKGRRLYYRIKLLDHRGHVRQITVNARPAVRTNFMTRKRLGR